MWQQVVYLWHHYNTENLCSWSYQIRSDWNSQTLIPYSAMKNTQNYQTGENYQTRGCCLHWGHRSLHREDFWQTSPTALIHNPYLLSQSTFKLPKREDTYKGYKWHQVHSWYHLSYRGCGLRSCLYYISAQNLHFPKSSNPLYVLSWSMLQQYGTPTLRKRPQK